MDFPVPALPVTNRLRPPASMSSSARANSGLISIRPADLSVRPAITPRPASRPGRFRAPAFHGIEPIRGRRPSPPQSGLPRNASSTGTRKPFARRLVSFASPVTAISSANISSVMPLARAPAVWLWMQYSQLLVALTAT